MATITSISPKTILLPSSFSSNHSSDPSRSKKRARFVEDDEPETVKSSTFTFNTDDPPLKKLKPDIANQDRDLDRLDVTQNDLLCREIYLAFLDTAFTDRINGQFERYDQLLGQFEALIDPSSISSSTQPTPTSIPRIKTWITSLTSMVSKLDRTHSALVQKVLSLPWAILDDQFVAAYSRFVTSLASARSEWIQLALEKIVSGFQYRSISPENRSAVLPSEVNRRLIYQRMHSLLKSILRLIPTLPLVLWPILDAQFPNKRTHRDSHVCYMINLLQITNYCPELSEQAIQLCVDRCVEIDVEIQVEVDEWEDEEGRLEEQIFGKSLDDAFDKCWTEDQDLASDQEDDEDDDGEELNFDDLSSDDGEEHLSDSDDKLGGLNPKGPSASSVNKVKELAATLDGMLRCIFDHLHHLSFGQAIKTLPSSSQSAKEDLIGEPLSTPQQTTDVIDPRLQVDREMMFDLLLSTFESAILRTRRTRHTQFLIFWFASLQPSFADSLLASLVECALYSNEDSSIPIVTRLAAVGYIASLISRARYIDRQTTRHVVSLLCARLELGLSRTGSAHTGNSNAMWYAIAQAVFYIFCFRWKDLLMSEEEDEEDEDLNEGRKFVGRWMGGLKVLERAIFSHLNPLKICAPTVVAQFAKVSHQTNFMYCYNLIRSNHDPRRITLDETIDHNRMIDQNEKEVLKEILNESKMDCFFPFDPFKLPLSSIYLKEIYRVWEGIPGNEEEEEEEEEKV